MEKNRKIFVMLASLLSPVRYDKSAIESVSVLASFLRHLNMRTLALALFVALALLTTMRGEEPATRESAPAKATTTEVIDNFSFLPKMFAVSAGATVTNHDKVFHAVTSADNQFQNAPLLKAGRASPTPSRQQELTLTSVPFTLG
jgi:plastocyanin